MKVDFYDGNITKFVGSLEKRDYAKVLRVLDALEQYGNALGMPYSKPVARNLFELRTQGTSRIRLFYSFFNHHAVILHIIKKKTAKIPRRDLDLALSRQRTLDKR